MRFAVVAIVWILVAACGHGAAAPATPDYPPLPPLSNTAVGLLIDQASQLQLTGAQLTSLQEIDHDLHVKNDVIEGDLSYLEQPMRPAAAADDGDDPGAAAGGGGGRMGGRRGGGGGGGRMGGRRGGGGGGRGGGGHPRGGDAPAAVDPHAQDHAAQAAQLRTQERANEQAAIEKAIPLLDPKQQDKARAIFAEHGFTASVGAPAPAAPADDPSPHEPAPPLVP